MKTGISVALAFALALAAVPAVASDTFHAFRALPAMEQATIAPLSDDQLASIEGKVLDVCVTCIAANAATVTQANVNTLSARTTQINDADVKQVAANNI